MPEAKPIRARMPSPSLMPLESLKSSRPQGPMGATGKPALESTASPALRPPLLVASQDTRQSQPPLADLPLPRGEERRRDGSRRHPAAARRGEPTPHLATGLWGRPGLDDRVPPRDAGGREPPRGRPCLAETLAHRGCGRAMQKQQPRPSAPRQLRWCLSSAELRVAIEMRDPGAKSRQ